MKRDRDPLEACALAGDLLRRAGFEVGWVSRRSEAVYYRLPGRRGFVRVAAHSFKGGPIGHEPVLAALTLSGNGPGGTGPLHCTDARIHNGVANAIGRYMLADADEAMAKPRNRYRGKRGTWEHADPVHGEPADVAGRRQDGAA